MVLGEDFKMINYNFDLNDLCYSLENDRRYIDYKIMDENRSYESLVTSHEKLHKEFMDHMKNMDDFLSRSSEGFDPKAILKWIMDTLKKIWTTLEAFVKRIVAKILELTMRSKQGLYVKFKNKAFTAVDITIHERKLQKDILKNIHTTINKYNGMLTGFNNTIAFIVQSGKAFDPLAFDEFSKRIHDEIVDIKERGISHIIKPMFYQTEKKKIYQ